MRYSAELVLVIFGCAITLTIARSVNQESLSRVVRSPQQPPADDPAGTPEAIRADPENTKGFIAIAKNNFQGIQSIVDKHFSKKKAEGDQINEAGDEKEDLAKDSRDKVETQQYAAIQGAFSDFQQTRTKAMDFLLSEDGNDAPAAPPKGDTKTNDFDSDEDTAAASAPPPPPPKQAPPPPPPPPPPAPAPETPAAAPEAPAPAPAPEAPADDDDAPADEAPEEEE